MSIACRHLLTFTKQNAGSLRKKSCVLCILVSSSGLYLYHQARKSYDEYDKRGDNPSDICEEIGVCVIEDIILNERRNRPSRNNGGGKHLNKFLEYKCKEENDYCKDKRKRTDGNERIAERVRKDANAADEGCKIEKSIEYRTQYTDDKTADPSRKRNDSRQSRSCVTNTESKAYKEEAYE